MNTQRIEKTTWTREEVQQAIDEGWTVHLRCGFNVVVPKSYIIEQGHISYMVKETKESACLLLYFGKDDSKLKDFPLSVIAYTLPPIEYVTREGGNRVVQLVELPPSDHRYKYGCISETADNDHIITWLTDNLNVSEAPRPFIIPKSEYEDYREPTPYEKLIARAYPVSGGA